MIAEVLVNKFCIFNYHIGSNSKVTASLKGLSPKFKRLSRVLGHIFLAAAAF